MRQPRSHIYMVAQSGLEASSFALILELPITMLILLQLGKRSVNGQGVHEVWRPRNTCKFSVSLLVSTRGWMTYTQITTEKRAFIWTNKYFQKFMEGIRLTLKLTSSWPHTHILKAHSGPTKAISNGGKWECRHNGWDRKKTWGTSKFNIYCISPRHLFFRLGLQQIFKSR